MSSIRSVLFDLLRPRVGPASIAWLEESSREVAALSDPSSPRFPALISLANRHVPRGALAPDTGELERARTVLEGWNPERWSLVDVARTALVLHRRDLESDAGVRALEEAFRYTDVGELVSLHRALPLVPNPALFAWRAGEGCRSSMRVVYEAAACDNPLPFRVFDAAAFAQLAVKALFVEAPLWRVFGLDQRLDEDLARMALDLAEERRAAGRRVQPELWLLLGRFGGERARASIERELAGSDRPGRAGAALALARAGGFERLRELVALEKDPLVRAAMEGALAGRSDQRAFAEIVGIPAG